MGLPILQDRFQEDDYDRFASRLREQLEALASLLRRPDFGTQASTVGVELEMSLVGADGRPLPQNSEVIAALANPLFTAELNRFNLEFNSAPVAFTGFPFGALEHDVQQAVGQVRQTAQGLGARVALVGILPTLVAADLQSTAMTDEPRYRALSSGILRLRRRPFRVRIDGDDPLHVETSDVTFEGANTSFQVHLQASPGEFARLYNAVQLATAPVLAVSGNSPTFLGHRLWEETRIALFKQTVDDRAETGPDRGLPRVCFGTGWLESSPIELFRDCVLLYEPLLPVLSAEDAGSILRSGGVPELDELRLHLGTVWRWNRPVYDPALGGHLRIELRALPSGPSIPDMLANVAFWLGLARGLLRSGLPDPRTFPFAAAQANFYRAAQFGLDAELLWPARGSARIQRARLLVAWLLPIADEGLAAAGVAPEERARHLGIIEGRVANGRTGARWQRERLARLESRSDRGRALTRLLEEYLHLSESGAPVHEWPLG